MRRLAVGLAERADTIALVLLSLLLTAISLSRLIYPFDVGHFEGCTWTPSLIAAQGGNPYAYAEREPFVMAPYGYFYYLVIGAGLRLFGLQFWFGRALSVISAAVCVLCIIRLSWVLTRNEQAVRLSVVTFLSAIVLYHWIAVHRPDLPSLALAFTALVFVFTSREEMGWRTLAVVVLLSLAFFVKQTTLIPAIVAVARNLQVGRWRQALVIALGVPAICLAVATMLNMTSEGKYLWQHFTLVRQVPYTYGEALHWALSLLKSPALWGALGLLGSAVFLSFNPRLRWSREGVIRFLQSPRILIGAYFLFSVIFAFVTSARRGAYINYYLEVAIVGAIAVAPAWKRINRPKLYLAVICLMTLAGALEFSRMARGESYRWRALGYYQEVVKRIASETPPQSLVISVHPELAVAAGREYHFGDWIQYQDGRSQRLFQVLSDSIKSHRYSAIIWILNDRFDFTGYRLAQMQHPVPVKYYPVSLYLRDDKR